ncbi:MAG: glycosyltransferase family 4 protein [Fusobacteriaceae bacterium]
MKILLDGRLISNKPTGISRYSREMVKIYQNYYGYENVQVIVNEELKEKPFNLIRTDLKPFDMIHFFKFHKFLKKIDAEIYHTLYHSNSFFKDKTKKYITTFHDIGHKILKSKINDNVVKDILIKIGIEFVIRRTLKNSDFIVSVSDTTRADIKNIYNYESIVIPEGINVIEVMDKQIESLEKNKFFLYVGNSRPNKNLKFLLDTFTEAKTDLKLVLVGNNNSLQINDSRIKSLGFVTDEELSWLYKNCEAFIFPSLYEGFGLPVLEAVHKGAKVYSSTGGSLKEFSEKLVKKFDPFDKVKLKYLLENTNSINFNKKEQLEELDKYDWKNIEILTIRKLFKKI